MLDSQYHDTADEAPDSVYYGSRPFRLKKILTYIGPYIRTTVEGFGGVGSIPLIGGYIRGGFSWLYDPLSFPNPYE